MKLRRWLCCGLVATSALLGAPRAGRADGTAATAAADADAQAAKWLSQGNKAFKEGKFDEAEKAYRQAFAMKKVYDIAGNLAMSEFAQGKSRDAAEHLAFALRAFPITGEPAQREQMQKTFEQSRAAVGALKVTVLPKGAQVFVDGKPVGEAPLLDDVFVDPGKHTVKATLEGFAEAQATADAQKGQSAAVSLALKAVPKQVVTVTTPSTDPPPQKRSPVPAFIAGGAAVVFFGVGGALLGVSSGKASDVEAQATALTTARKSCVATATNYDASGCATLEDTAHGADTLHNTGVALLVVGGVAAAGAVTWLLLPAPKPKKAGVLDLRALPVASPGQAGLLVTGAF